MDKEQKYRIVFMGTSIFSAIVLEKLLGFDKVEIAGVFAQPDKEAGRGRKVAWNEVKQLAMQHNLPLFQPASLRGDEIEKQIKNLRPDFLISAAYGLILPANILNLPKFPALNVHASLLPAYRGAAPIQHAIMDNWQEDGKTGVSIMEMVSELDAGPVYAMQEQSINGQTCGELQQQLAHLGAGLLINVLEDMLAGKAVSVPQDNQRATFAPKLTKKDGHIDWSRSALEVDARIRAMTPWPGGQAILQIEGHELPFYVTLLPGKPGEPVAGIQPGQLYRDKNGLMIACADRWYILDRIQPQGRKEMAARDFANGQCRAKKGVCGKTLAFE